jgi:hypothetical protein
MNKPHTTFFEKIGLPPKNLKENSRKIKRDQFQLASPYGMRDKEMMND